MPADLVKLYGKESIRKSLGTTDKSKARLLTGQLVALYETEFASHRKAMNPETLHIVTPTMRDQLCERIKWRMLDGDDTRRHEPDRLLGFLTAMEFSAPPRHFLPHEAPDYLNPADVGLNPKRIERLRQIETFLDRWMTEEMTFGHLELAQHSRTGRPAPWAT
ncbi:MAG TPA: DUF6538 domain-containing protein [Pseudorhodoferax sp.]|nr:DUF6538 domain-containing protein [Pseudorhodoferax sp.]